MVKSKAKTYAAIMVEAFDGISEKEAEKKVRALKSLLYRRGDFKQISKILREFSRAWKERKGKTATVVTAEALSEQAKKQVEQSLQKNGYRAEEKVDPGVIGGMALYLGSDYVVDSTVRGKLQRLSASLKFEN
jgi:F0F1-type ATP synthase delta subunit